jgi:predicted transcriptional regulator
MCRAVHLKAARCPARSRVALSAMTEEINAKDWKTFCERVTEMERGQMVTIEEVTADGAHREVARALPLEQVTFRTRDACNDAIAINGSDGFEHEIVEPIHVRLKRNAEGGFNPVQIDAETGTTILHFRPALKPTVVDGLSRS